MKNNKYDELENIIIKPTDKQSKMILISTIISILFLVIYIALVTLYFSSYGFKSFFETFIVENVKTESDAAFIIIALPLTLIIKFSFDIIMFSLLTFIPLICFANILINQKALKTNNMKFYKAVKITGIMSLSIINYFVAKNIINEYQSK